MVSTDGASALSATVFSLTLGRLTVFEFSPFTGSSLSMTAGTRRSYTSLWTTQSSLMISVCMPLAMTSLPLYHHHSLWHHSLCINTAHYDITSFISTLLIMTSFPLYQHRSLWYHFLYINTAHYDITSFKSTPLTMTSLLLYQHRWLWHHFLSINTAHYDITSFVPTPLAMTSPHL